MALEASPKPVPTPLLAEGRSAGLIGLILALGVAAYFLADRAIAAHGPAMADWFEALPGWTRFGIDNLLWCFYLFFGLIFMLGLLLRRREWVRAGLVYGLAQLVYSLLALRIIKILLGRPRPFLGDISWQPVSLEPDFHSLPSGHSADALAGLVVIWLFFRRPGPRLAGTLVAVLTMASRLFRHEHYLSDVILGGLIGGVGAVLAARTLARWLRPQARPDPGKVLTN